MAKENKSITVMVPAYNEENHLEKAVKNLDSNLKRYVNDYEIIIVDDCSSDKTPEIADNLAKKNKKIKVVHNKKNMGLGYNYKKGFQIAKKKYYMYSPGDDDVDHNAIPRILKRVGEADIIISYISNQKDRPVIRKMVSVGYTNILNLIFRLNIKYYNGVVVHKRSILKKVDMTTHSFAYQTEILVKLLKQGYSYIEIPFKTIPREKSRIFRIKNALGVISTIIKLFYNVNIKRNFN